MFYTIFGRLKSILFFILEQSIFTCYRFGEGTPQKAGSVSSANVTPSTDADRSSLINDSPMTDLSDSPMPNVDDSTAPNEDKASRKQLMFGLGGPRPDLLSNYNEDEEW